ncbi:hypothetical protein VC83_04499 [Pseudogymnoascus destructans]|uniref:Dolichyl-diphosphooligosaccharide--protein glycosyltransferase subunit 4 n=1 Tax=Pseudogymnoascus destructans TaxID=655981 RepID=A0A177AB16_9PEZI|nr:uncharacterized protein VC83_04499 [Pseudogymnoascus destructans]OAF59277.1 hypothetical protein VC83_04499 [Pseudogymnoascus destructans]
MATLATYLASTSNPVQFSSPSPPRLQRVAFRPAFLGLVAKMISDDELYSLAIFLGSAAMLMIVLYHFLEANSVEDVDAKTRAPVAAAASSSKAKSAIQ